MNTRCRYLSFTTGKQMSALENRYNRFNKSDIYKRTRRQKVMNEWRIVNIII